MVQIITMVMVEEERAADRKNLESWRDPVPDRSSTQHSFSVPLQSLPLCRSTQSHQIGRKTSKKVPNTMGIVISYGIH